MNRRHIKFIFVVFAIVVIWGGVLPRLAETETVQNRNRWLDEHKIDPAAMFYTDLPMMDDVLRKTERRPQSR
ncbi:MAG: hypothetical protein KDB00_28860 [Planctomycetales bacterium]|nr:hypothetical protein [Planctomycetales bacterium]